MTILLRQCGTAVDVISQVTGNTPRELVEYLKPALQYRHVEMLHGLAQYDPVTGQRETVRVVTRDMFVVHAGRLTTGYGFLPRIAKMLHERGLAVEYVDISPPRQRPDCYTLNWDWLSTFPLRPAQLTCVQAVAASPGGIINATYGYGKTYLLAAICMLYPKAKIAVVVDGVSTMHRTYNHLVRHFPNVGLVGDGCRTVGERITVYSAGSIGHCDGDVDILLADEVHRLMAAKKAEELSRVFTQTRNFGLSATLRRVDKADAQMEMFFGPVIYKLTYPEAVAAGMVVPLRVRWLRVQLSNNPAARGSSKITRLRWGIWRNDARNAIIAKDVRENYGEDQQVLVATATIDHAVHLLRHMPEFVLCYGSLEEEKLEAYKKNGLLPADAKVLRRADKLKMQKDFESGELRRVIATDVWSTGVDFCQLQVLYRADARSTEIIDGQWPGRTSRLYEGKTFAEVVDCYDEFDTGFLNKSKERCKHYKEQGWEQVGLDFQIRKRVKK